MGRGDNVVWMYRSLFIFNVVLIPLPLAPRSILFVELFQLLLKERLLLALVLIGVADLQ